MANYGTSLPLLSNKKEWIIDTCNDLDISQESYAGCRKANTQVLHAAWFHLYSILEIIKLRDGEKIRN